ncbi:hypothetical protein H9P43_000407 [Blastocladiella emersonii ATCC 22665]|nr:hypothetical protein H9P43_000407 [Blastocladiella emersonii ATCC 22665]
MKPSTSRTGSTGGTTLAIPGMPPGRSRSPSIAGSTAVSYNSLSGGTLGAGGQAPMTLSPAALAALRNGGMMPPRGAPASGGTGSNGSSRRGSNMPNSGTGAPGRSGGLRRSTLQNSQSASTTSVPAVVTPPVEEKPLPPLDPEAAALCETIGISPREYYELYEVFRLVDKDGGGTISKDELELLMQTLGIRASKVELEIMVNEIVSDPNKDEIDLETFITAMSRKVTTSLPQEALMQAFRLFDEGGPATPIGRIRTEMLFTVMERMGNPERFMKREDIEDLLSQVAPQALETGYLDYANFVGMLFSS